MSDESTGTVPQPNTEGATPTDQNSTGQQGETILTSTTETPSKSEPIYENKESAPGETKKEIPQVEKAPEKYEAFKMPEGMEFSGSTLDKFSSLARELNLPQEKAQRLIDIASENAKSSLQAQQTQRQKAQEGWIANLKSDTEFGGANFDRTIIEAKRGLKQFGSEEFGDFLAKTGLGNHNEIVKVFAKIGRALSEDRAVDGEQVFAPKSAADIIYGSNT